MQMHRTLLRVGATVWCIIHLIHFVLYFWFVCMVQKHLVDDSSGVIHFVHVGCVWRVGFYKVTKDTSIHFLRFLANFLIIKTQSLGCCSHGSMVFVLGFVPLHSHTCWYSNYVLENYVWDLVEVPRLSNVPTWRCFFIIKIHSCDHFYY